MEEPYAASWRVRILTRRGGEPEKPDRLMIDIDLDPIRAVPAFVELLDEEDKPTLPPQE